MNDFDWTKDVPTALDWNKLYTWDEMQEFLEDKFRGTRFEIRIDDNRMFNIDDEEGTYHDWDMDEHDTINIGDILDPIKYTCDHYDGGREIRDEYRELYNTIVGYEHYPTGPLAESFDWAEDIPDTLTVGEIKQKFGGFRDYFSVGDIVEVKGSIPCESLRNEGCVINLSNSQYEVTDVLRTRMAIKPLDPDMLKTFEDEWGDDGHSKVYIGVENGDDDLYVDRISSELTESLDWVRDVASMDKYAGPLHNVQYIRLHHPDKSVFTIHDDNRDDYVIVYQNRDGVTYDRPYDRNFVQMSFDAGLWKKVGSVNESFDWVQDVPPGYDGWKFKAGNYADIIYNIKDKGGDQVEVWWYTSYDSDDKSIESTIYDRSDVDEYFNDTTWVSV